MSALLMSLASIGIPVGIVVMLEYPSDKWFGIGMLIIGIIALPFALIRAKGEDDERFEIVKRLNDIAESRHQEMLNIIKDVSISVNSLILEMRKERDERNNQNK